MSGPYMPIDRRKMLAGAALAGASLFQPHADGAPAPKRNRLPMKKSINQWAFPYPEKMSLEQCLRLAKDAGFSATHVPYKGSAPGMLDLASGQVQFMVDTINSTLPMIRDGRLRALAVATSKRSSVLPELPTIAESLIPGFEMSAWQGIVVPTGTPASIISRLNTELQKVLASSEVRSKLLASGTEILGGSPEQYSSYIQQELKRFAQLAREAGARID